MVAAEVPEVDGVEGVGRAASPAVLGVGGVRHPRQRHRVVLDAEVERAGMLAPEVGDERIVGVEHQPLGTKAVLPALDDRLQLAVAVELIAKEVMPRLKHLNVGARGIAAE